MKVSKAATIRIGCRNAPPKKNTRQSYLSVIDRFCQDFGDCELDQIAPAAGFSDFLCDRQGDGAESRKAGWNPFATA
jgi:hypothetical protein